MVTFEGHVVHGNVATLVVALLLVFTFVYAFPAIYNFWVLFDKAKKPGWAAIIPIYGPIVACQIAKKPIWLGVIFGIAGFQVSAPSNVVYIINAVQFLILLLVGITILSGLAKQYKASRVFWLLLVLLPLAASSMVKSVIYKPTK